MAHNRRLRDYTNLPLEIFVISLSILPFFLLAYFYSALPDRVPLFMKLNGEVAVWGEKSAMSVFRVPLMAVVTQVFCLLMKYGAVHSQAVAPLALDHSALQERYLSLSTGVWDWFRWTVAFKMSAESLNTIFLSIARFNFLSQPAFIITVVATLIGVAGALFYLYRLLGVAREMKKQFPNEDVRRPVDKRLVYAGAFYFNRSDSALFVSKYGFNFANVRAWVFIACVIAYPLLVFLPG
ncbi:MAG: hypothetical protein LC794_00440 [Acidobacteria bacterium]|nr:hypothetical protein [Acidobacteriota bacterium]